MRSTQIKKLIEYLFIKYKTNNPFKLCDYLGYKIIYKDYGLDKFKGKCVPVLGEIIIYLNSNLSKEGQSIVLAHEIGHALIHNVTSNFDGSSIDSEYDANLFAAYLLLDEDNYDLKFSSMNSYLLKNVVEDLAN